MDLIFVMLDVSVAFIFVSPSSVSNISGFLLSVGITGTMNPKVGTTYHAQPVSESLHITYHCGYTRNLYLYIYNFIM